MLSCQAVDCELDTIGTSKHCEIHVAQFKPLYLKYKRLHTHIKDKLKVPLETYNVYELLKLSSSLEELYSLRSDYRKAAFRPEYHDIGHSRILHEVLHKLDEVKLLLTKIFENGSTITNFPETEEEQLPSQGSITFITNIRNSVVAQHKEEWDKQSRIDYNYNTQMEAKLKFVIDSSVRIFKEMNLPYPKQTFDILFYIYALADYANAHKDDQKPINIMFIGELHKYIDKYNLTFKLYSEVYKSLIAKEPLCLINNLSNLPNFKPRAIVSFVLNNNTIISFHRDNDIKYVCPFKLTQTGWNYINKLDTIYISKAYETFGMVRSSVQGLSVSQKIKRIRDMKKKAIMENSRKHK